MVKMTNGALALDNDVVVSLTPIETRYNYVIKEDLTALMSAGMKLLGMHYRAQLAALDGWKRPEFKIRAVSSDPYQATLHTLGVDAKALGMYQASLLIANYGDLEGITRAYAEATRLFDDTKKRVAMREPSFEERACSMVCGHYFKGAKDAIHYIRDDPIRAEIMLKCIRTAAKLGDRK
jgi:hypothetical protein